MSRIFEYVPLLLLLIPLQGQCHSQILRNQTQKRTEEIVRFNRSTTGVVVSPYVKNSEKGNIPTTSEYTLEDIKTMYEVVATKFKMTATYTSGLGKEYKENDTYHHNKEKVVLCPEAASLVNQGHNKTALTVLIGILLNMRNPPARQVAIELAFESAAIANKNYPGTATGLIFTNYEMPGNSLEAIATLDLLRENKQRAHDHHLSVGSRLFCSLLGATKDKEDRKVAEIIKSIVLESDFVICTVWLGLDGKNGSEGVDATVKRVKEEVRGYKKTIPNINPKVEVMFETGWPDKGPEGWETTPNLIKYWRLVDAWAQEEQIKVWMIAAFDNPILSSFSTIAHVGWWKLTRNRDVERMEGYVEKINDRAPPEEPETSPTNPWMYVGITAGVVMVVGLTAAIAFLYIRVNKLNDNLTKEDIRQFMHGVPITYTEENGHVQSALRIPYNQQRFEIEKNRIFIQRHNQLGAGQFGYVFKAVVERTPGKKKEVALKMTKPGCSKADLKGMLSEIKVLTYLGKHKNIVSIVGAYTKEMEKGTVYIALELCTVGSLEKFLRNNKYSGGKEERLTVRQKADLNALSEEGVRFVQLKQCITFPCMLRWAYEIASGMEYLALKNVVHADLAARNILLTGNKTAKITDFGLSRRLYDYANYVKQQQEPLPWRWMSLESLKKLEFSSQTDVWSYGVTLWEIFSFGDVPYPGLSWSLNFVSDLEDGLRMLSPKHASPEVYQVMRNCWAELPKDRPKFPALKEIMVQLLGIVDS